MGDELRVSFRTQFVQVHALLFPINRHALRIDKIEKPVQAKSRRQHKPDQRGQAHDLRQPLPSNLGSGGAKNSHRQYTQTAGQRMHRDGSSRVVDAQSKLQPLH